jgi:hypothetical protein
MQDFDFQAAGDGFGAIGGFNARDGEYVGFDPSTPKVAFGSRVEFLRFDKQEDGRHLATRVARDYSFPTTEEQRVSLSDTDPSKWPVGDYGRQDPWIENYTVDFVCPQSLEIVSFSAMRSQLCRRAVQGLVALIGRAQKWPGGAGKLPLVEFRKQNVSTKFGVKPKPWFFVTEWVANPFAKGGNGQAEIESLKPKALTHDTNISSFHQEPADQAPSPSDQSVAQPPTPPAKADKPLTVEIDDEIPF